MNEETGAYSKGKRNSRGNLGTSNSPRTQQAEQRTLLAIESLGTRSDNAQMARAKIVDRSPVEILLNDGRADI
jgi:hypothetical protein